MQRPTAINKENGWRTGVWPILVLALFCGGCSFAGNSSAYGLENAKEKIAKIKHKQDQTVQLLPLQEQLLKTLLKIPGVTAASCALEPLLMEEDAIDVAGTHHKGVREVIDFWIVFSTLPNEGFDGSKVQAAVRDALKACGLSAETVFRPSFSQNEWAITGLVQPVAIPAHPK